MNHRKLIALILAILTVCFLCACGNTTTQTALHPNIAKPGSDASADLSLTDDIRVETSAEAVVYELIMDEDVANAQIEGCFDIKLDEMKKSKSANFKIYTNNECEVMYDEECGYWIYSTLNRQLPAANASLSDEEAIGIAKAFVEKNKLWNEEISDIKVVDQYGLNENMEYGVDTKSVYFYPQIDGKTVVGRFRISLDIDMSGKIFKVNYMVNPLGEAIPVSLKTRADIAADVAAGDYSASFSMNMAEAKINSCKYGYYADGAERGGKTYLYPVYIMVGEGTTAVGEPETFDIIIDAQK